MRPTLPDRIGHIVDAIEKIDGFVANHTRDSFTNDLAVRLIVERLLEVISEASRYIPDDVKGREPTINWRGLADLGNRLRHAYHRVDADLLWTMIRNDLEPLKTFVHAIVRKPNP